jgi:hypothetical protein
MQSTLDKIDFNDKDVMAKEYLPKAKIGEYVLEVLAFKHFWKDDGAEMVGFEFKVREATPESLYRAGDCFQHNIRLNTKYAKSNVRAARQAIGAVTDQSANDITAQDIKDAYAEDQPLKGHLVAASIVPNPKDAKYPFVNYRPFRGELKA